MKFVSSMLRVFRRQMAQLNCEAKVAVLGASGGIGQPLSLLLKQLPGISELRLYDVKAAPGVVADLGHINTSAKIVGSGVDIDEALNGADIVLISAGKPRKPGMTRDDLFTTNASICATLIDQIAQKSPEAIICIITNPVNSTLPIASEVMKYRKVFDARKLIGVTTLDSVRASTFVSQLKNIPVAKVSVPVIAGHSGGSIVPLLSQTQPQCSFTMAEQESLVHHIQNAGTEVVEAKAGAGSATLAMAYAASVFLQSLLRARAGEPNTIECAMTEHPGEIPFFAEPHLLGREGAIQPLGIGKLSAYEEALLEKAKAELQKNIRKGVEFGKAFCQQLK